MIRNLKICGLLMVALVCSSQAAAQLVSSRVYQTGEDEQVLLQEMVVAAPIEAVWNAYTTVEGWTAWASPRAEIDLRNGGTIRTAYEGEIGDEGTITLRIINYLPRQLLTLKSDVSKHWPEVMRKDADNLSNVILFDEVAVGRTRIRSYGIGYSTDPEYERLLQFFIQANEGLFEVLRGYLEDGKRADWGRGDAPANN